MEGYTIISYSPEGEILDSYDIPMRGERWIRNYIKDNIKEDNTLIEIHYGIFTSEGDLIRHKHIDYTFHLDKGRLSER